MRAAASELLVPGDVTVLVTDQPFEDVSEELSAEAKRDGDLLRVPVDAKGPPGGVAPTQLVTSDVPVSDIYRC